MFTTPDHSFSCHLCGQRCSIIFPRTEVKLTRQYFPGSSSLPFLKTGMTFAFFQSSSTSPDSWPFKDDREWPSPSYCLLTPLTRFNSLTFFVSFQLTQTASLYLFQVAWPFFQLLCIFCLCLSNDRGSLFTHACLLLPLVDFLLIRMHHSWVWRNGKLRNTVAWGIERVIVTPVFHQYMRTCFHCPRKTHIFMTLWSVQM